MSSKHIHIYLTPKKVTRDADQTALRKELAILETRYNNLTPQAPLRLKAEVMAKIREIEKKLGTKDSVASVEKEIATQERLIEAAKKAGKEPSGTVLQRLKFLKEELAKEKAKAADTSLSRR